MTKMRNAACAALVLILSMSALAGQKYKPWNEWTKKDAEKILNDSAWGQTQVETDTTEMNWSTASRPIEGRGQLNQSTSVNFFIRFLSAKPIRQALARMAELDTSANSPKQIENAKAYAEQKFDQTIVVAVSFESKDGRFSGLAFQALGSAITSTLKNNTFLELKGGKRIFLQEYQAPTQGGVGAIFIFPRSIDGVPVVDPKGGDLRFWAEFPGGALTLNMRFKIANMIYDGVLEY